MRKYLKPALKLIGAFLFCGFSAGIFINFIFPQLSGWPGFSTLNPKFPIVINRTEQVYLSESIDTRDVYEQTRPAVVTILAHRGSLSPQVQEFESPAISVGVIVTVDGVIFASRQGLGTANRIEVLLNDGKIYPAQRIVSDTKTDLQLLKIEAQNLPIVEFNTSADLQIGDRVIAVGSSFTPYQHPMVSGLVTSTLSPLAAYANNWSTEDQHEYLHLDRIFGAEYNGGPVVDRSAKVAGLVNAQGVLPSYYLADSLNQYLKDGTVQRAVWGIRYDPVTPGMAQAAGLPKSYGALVLSGVGIPAVASGSAAAAAGLREGDFIYKINSQELDASHSFERLSSAHFPGEKVTFQFLRAGAEHTTTLNLR